MKECINQVTDFLAIKGMSKADIRVVEAYIESMLEVAVPQQVYCRRTADDVAEVPAKKVVIFRG